MENDDVLQHFGVLGMKWGKRKMSSSKNTNNHSEDYKKKTSLKKKKITEMSNAELRTLNERMQLEKSYKYLKQSEVSQGRKIAKEILTNVAKTAVSAYILKTSGLAGRQIQKYTEHYFKTKFGKN